MTGVSEPLATSKPGCSVLTVIRRMADEAGGFRQPRGGHRGLALHDDLVAVFALRGRAGAVGQRDRPATVEVAGLEDEARAQLRGLAVLFGHGKAEEHDIAALESSGQTGSAVRGFGS